MLAIYMYHRAWARKNSDGEFFSVTIFLCRKARYRKHFIQFSGDVPTFFPQKHLTAYVY